MMTSKLFREILKPKKGLSELTLKLYLWRIFSIRKTLNELDNGFSTSTNANRLAMMTALAAI